MKDRTFSRPLSCQHHIIAMEQPEKKHVDTADGVAGESDEDCAPVEVW